MASFLGRTDLPRGIRNNNPGNLIITNESWIGKIPRAQNTDGVFEQFSSIELGIRAMAIDILGDVQRNNYTLTQLINEYAPPSENPTSIYINTIASNAGINANVPLVFNNLILSEVLRSMIDFENGNRAEQLVTNEMIVGGMQLLPEYWLDRLGQFVEEKKSYFVPVAFTIGAIVYGLYRFDKWSDENRH